MSEKMPNLLFSADEYNEIDEWSEDDELAETALIEEDREELEYDEEEY